MELSGEPSFPHREPPRDPYGGVVITICALAACGMPAIGTAGVALSNRALLDAAISLLIVAASLARVAIARRRPPAGEVAGTVALAPRRPSDRWP